MNPYAMMPMSPKDFKRLAQRLGLPSGGEMQGSKWTWYKSGGYAGQKVVTRVKQAAEKLGWKPSSRQHTGNPDGSVMGTDESLVSPEGHRLSTSASYGSTKSDNSFHIDLKLAEDPGKSVEWNATAMRMARGAMGENRVVKLNQDQLRRIIGETIRTRIGEGYDHPRYGYVDDDDEGEYTLSAFMDELQSRLQSWHGVEHVSDPSSGTFVVTMNDGTTFLVTVVRK